MEDVIYQKGDSKVVEFNQYFMAYGYNIRENAFSSIYNLFQALQVLKKYYEEKKNNYKSDYSLLLLRLTYQIVLKFETEPLWFNDSGKEICKILTDISEIVYGLDEVPDKYSQNTIDLIRIYVYKVKEQCRLFEIS